MLRAAQLALCGQKPETALNSAAAAIQFYLQQTNLVAQLREQQLQAKIVKTQEACKRKLQEVHDAYTAVRVLLRVGQPCSLGGPVCRHSLGVLQAKRKCRDVSLERDQLAADKQELLQKYAQKASQVW
jgi:hypothetical protein